MTDSDFDAAAPSRPPLADDLPPVQPPSAGFIVQLFVFPACIVMGVVAIWWAFGLIAVGEQDWRKLLQDLQSQNVLLRNRAMYGLAKVLDQDSRRGEQGQNLRANREIAQGLADQLVIELKKNSTSEEGMAIQEYLARALGMMDSLDATAPALRMALEPQRDVKIRKCAMMSLSMVAGRAKERGQPLSDPAVIESLIQQSGDSYPIMRQTAAFALGLFDSSDATHQLEVLLENGDPMTAVNAAIGLARSGSTKGFDVMQRELAQKTLVESSAKNPDAVSDQFLVVKNVLKAVSELAPKFDPAQREKLIPLVEELSAHHPEIRIRIDAEATLNSLKSQGR
jgi:HEAT repeat protein